MADVVLTTGVDTTGIGTGMAAIRNEVQKTGISVSSTLGSLISPAGLVTAALTTGLRSLVDYGSRVQDLSDRFKVSTTSLQQFGAIAEQNGSSMEGLAKGFNRLAVALSQARQGNVEMQKTLEALNITNWADKSLDLSQAVLQVGRSSMEAAQMVKVFGREGTSLAETFKYAAEHADKLGKAISPEMIRKLDDLDDRWKGMWVNIRVGAANSIEALEKINNWLDKILGHPARKLIFSNGLPQRDPNSFTGGGGTFAGKGAGSSWEEAAGIAQATVNQELLNEAVEAEEKARQATLTQSQHLAELTANRENLQNQINAEIATEGEFSDRALQLRAEIADITADIIPLQEKVADQSERDADAQERAAAAAERRAEQERKAADEAAKQDAINKAAFADQIRNAAGNLAENNLRLGATSDVYVAAVAASRGIKPGTPAYQKLLTQITAQDQLRNMRGQNLGWEEQLNRDKLVQWYAAGQAQAAATRSNIVNNQQIAFLQALAHGMPPPAGYNAYGSFQPGGNASPGTANSIVDNGNLTNRLLQEILLRLTPQAGGI